MIGAADLFEQAMAWLRENYGTFRFFTERDAVWTVQRHIQTLSDAHRCFHGYPLLPGQGFGAICADLAIQPMPVPPATKDTTGRWRQSPPVEVAVEFKYEPAHSRGFDPSNDVTDIWPTKFPIINWTSVEEDIRRIREFVAKGRAKVAYAILVDEGGYFRRRASSLHGTWVDWANGPSVHWTRVEAP